MVYQEIQIQLFDSATCEVVKEKLKNTKKDPKDSLKKNYNNLNNFEAETRNLSKREQEELLNLACKIDLPNHVRNLLDYGTDPNTVIPGRKHSVLEVARKGLHDVLEVLADSKYNTQFNVLTPKTGETVLHHILKKDYDDALSDGKDNFQLCLDVLVNGEISEAVKKQIKLIINKKDRDGNTALHYATQKWPQATVRQLLEFGANIGIKNDWEEVAISKIRPETMEEFLDEFCLSHNGKNIHDTELSIEFRYDFLAPSKDSIKEMNSKEDEEQQVLIQDARNDANALPETESLWYMGQSKEHRKLLKHPVIASFLWYKWKRIRGVFNRNIRFFSLFVYTLTWYVFESFGGSYYRSKGGKECGYAFFLAFSISITLFTIRDWICFYNDCRRSIKREGWLTLGTAMLMDLLIIAGMLVLLIFIDVNENAINGSKIHLQKYLLVVLLGVLIIREILQLLMSIKRYVSSPVNLMEVTLIACTFKMLHNSDGSFEENRHLGAVSIFLSWALLITMICKHPKFNRYNIYVTMFYKVLKNFFFFLTWYSIFIIAFGLGFYIMLHDDNRSEVGTSGDENKFFNSTWLSLVKSATMFIGEIEFGDLPFNLNSPYVPISFLFFLAFIFLIVVVLMNLLNGLAVGEIGEIRDKAEIYSYLSQVETISYIESTMLGDPFNFLNNIPIILSCLPSCSVIRLCYKIRAVKNMFGNVFGPGILLFYNYLEETRLIIKPNEDSGICCCGASFVQNYCCCLSVDEMGREIISSAKTIIVRRLREDEEIKKKKQEQEKIEQERNEDKGKIIELENQLKEIKYLIQNLKLK